MEIETEIENKNVNEPKSSTGRDAVKLIVIMVGCIAAAWLLVKALEQLF